MQKDRVVEYSLLAGAAYIDSTGDSNQLPSASGWQNFDEGGGLS